MSHPQSEREIRRIVLGAVDECAVCGHDYPDEAIIVLGQQGDLWLLLLCCPGCQRQGVIAAFVNAGAPEASIITFDPPADFPQADGPGPVAAADVEAMRQFLASFDGDIARYLR